MALPQCCGELSNRPVGATPRPSLDTVVRPGLTLEEIQRRAIQQALERAGGNRALASRMLDISERTLYRRIEEYGLD